MEEEGREGEGRRGDRQVRARRARVTHDSTTLYYTI
jgi:hypothetical protein